MFAIANGRKALWQWDLNQQLTVAGDCTEVHYLDRGALSTLTVAVKDGKADIPNILLQRPGRLVVYAYIIDAQDHHTKICEAFGISARPKPDDYVYTETEVKTWSDLQSQIGDLADLATDEKDSLVAAINEAAQSGGGGGGGESYELIKGITLLDDVGSIDITTNESGEAFSLKALKILFEGTCTDAKGTDLYLNAARKCRAKVLVTTDSIGEIAITPEFEKMKIIASLAHGKNSLALANFLQGWMEYEPITAIKIRVSSVDAVYSSGTKIIIMGIKV